MHFCLSRNKKPKQGKKKKKKKKKEEPAKTTSDENKKEDMEAKLRDCRLMYCTSPRLYCCQNSQSSRTLKKTSKLTEELVADIAISLSLRLIKIKNFQKCFVKQ